MEREHIRFQVQTDTRERELHFTLLYCFQASLQKFLKRSGKGSIQKVKKSEIRKPLF